MICPQCGAEMGKKNECEYCGYIRPPKICPFCHQETYEEICPNCSCDLRTGVLTDPAARVAYEQQGKPSYQVPPAEQHGQRGHWGAAGVPSHTKPRRRTGCLVGIIIFIIAIAVLVGFVGVVVSYNDDTYYNYEETWMDSSYVVEEGWYGPGMYKVGRDLPAGEYVLEGKTIYAYYRLTSDSTGDSDSYLASGYVDARGYLTLEEGQYLELDDCVAAPVDLAGPYQVENNEYPAGIYKVGYDLPAGEYEILPTDEEYDAYMAVLSGSSGTFDDIVTNDNFDKKIYVTVSDGQYLEISRGVARPVE